MAQSLMAVTKSHLVLSLTAKANRCLMSPSKTAKFKTIRITSDIAANKLSPDHAENYRRTPTRVNLENVEVTGSGRVGIYFDDYVTHSTLKNSVVRDSYMSGIYLEHSSRNNAIVGNQIINNGHESFGKAKREGLAVDSSAYNLIEGNRFRSE